LDLQPHAACSEGLRYPLPEVFVPDTIGELALCYLTCNITFVGGSLVAEGGHNPTEPAISGIPVLFGPHVEDFSEIAADLLATGGGLQVVNVEELAKALNKLLKNPDFRKETGAAATAFIKEKTGRHRKTSEADREIFVKRGMRCVADNILCAVSLAFTVGIALSWSPNYRHRQILCIVVTGFSVFLLSRMHRHRSAMVMILVLFVILGNLYGSMRGTAPANPSDLSNLVQDKKEAILVGILQRLQGFNGEVSRAEMDCEDIRFKILRTSLQPRDGSCSA